MTLQQFHVLSPDIQRSVVQVTGAFLSGRTGVDVTAKLYGVEGFYVELFFDEKMSEVVRVVAFEETDKLEPYLRLVNVTELQPYLNGTGA